MPLRLPASERKEQILDVALSVFASKGYHDASMSDIAEEEPLHLRTFAQGVVGASEGVARHLTNSGAEFDPNVVGKQVADLLWGGLRGVGNL